MGKQSRIFRRSIGGALALALASLGLHAPVQAAPEAALPRMWTPLSSAAGHLPIPPGGDQQTALLAGDLDGDGDRDLVLGSRRGTNAVVWYRNGGASWDVVILEAASLGISAGGALHDVDGDGDLDVVLLGDLSTNAIWWWRNPGPGGGDLPWERFVVKNTGAVHQHDLGFGDFDGDGNVEMAFWNQGLHASPLNHLYLAEVPADPTAGEWPRTLLYDSDVTAEGIAVADVDGDGTDDLVTAGGWFQLVGGTLVREQFPDSAPDGQVAVGQLVPGGRPEVVVASGDVVGELDLYQWTGGAWTRTSLLDLQLPGPWRNGHSLDLGDVDGDGHLDVFSAEMALAAPVDARSVVLLGDGAGNFRVSTVSEGVDNHESLLVDVDGDGDPDVVTKPFNDGTPGLSIFRNDRRTQPVGSWTRHEIGQRSAGSLFTLAGDVDGDGDRDVVTGANWFENPGRLDRAWVTHTIGAPLTDAVVLEDLDGDGDLDVFGTQGQGFAGPTYRFAWAANDGSGGFTVRQNVEHHTNSFLQGATTVRFSPSGPLEIWLSWNDRSSGIQRVVVPDDPGGTTWPNTTVTDVSQGEQIDFADIDRDGDLDLLEGHIWLRNDGGGHQWTRFDLHTPTICCMPGIPDLGDRLPDRVVAADVNGDGRVDSVVSHEYDLTNSVAWYEQPADPTDLWTEHIMTADRGLPIHNLDVADMDGDGDLDAVAAQYDVDDTENGDAWVLENVDGAGRQWAHHLVNPDEQNHDGMQLADLDGDGDLDVHSIGWRHDRVVVYENLAGVDETDGWWKLTHRYRLNVTVAADPDLTDDQLVNVGVNFTSALDSVDARNVADPDTVRVVEVNAAGGRVDANVAYRFVAADDHDQAHFNAGTVTILLEGPTLAERHLQLYFEPVGTDVGAGGTAVDAELVTSGLVTGIRTRAGRSGTGGHWDGSPRPPETGAFVESGGAVTFEAEHHVAARLGTSVHTWQSHTTPAGWSGAGVMKVLPDSGATVDTGHATASPSLRYLVSISNPGTYHVWLRGRAPAATGDSVHTGVDGVATPSADRIDGFRTTSYDWLQQTLDGAVATVSFSTPGVHTFEVWMREDGFILDKIHLTRINRKPIGGGPAESRREGGTANVAPVARFTVSPTTGPAPLTINVNAASSSDTDGAITDYRWNFGDGTTATGRTATHTYDTAGSRIVSLEVEDEHGVTHVAASAVVVGGAPPTTAAVPPTSVAVVTGTLVSGGAAALKAVGGATYSVRSGKPAGQTGQVVLWRADVTKVPQSLSGLSVTYRGSNSRACTQRVSLWNWSTGAWVTLDERSAGTAAVGLPNLRPAAGTPLAAFVSGTAVTGSVRVGVRCTQTGTAVTSRGDQLSVTYNR